MWAEIDFKGKVYRVYNAHLETTGINRTLHKAAKMTVQGFTVDNNRLLNAIYGNYTVGMIARAGQANILAMDMRESEVPVIVCGDFNDVPYSYVYKTRGAKKVRIDYIFHDEALEGVTYYKKEYSYSDHYPVFMKLKAKE